MSIYPDLDYLGEMRVFSAGLKNGDIRFFLT